MTQRTIRWQWLVALLPYGLIALVVLSWQAPGDRTSYLSLAGTWHGIAVHGDGEARVAQPSLDGFRPLAIPGQFAKQGLEGPSVVIRQTFALPVELRGDDLTLTLGYVHRAIVRVWVNGELVGVRGDASSRFLGTDTELSSYVVPERLLRSGQATIALEITSLDSRRNGVIDRRMLLGRSTVLLPWVFTQAVMRAMLEAGSTLTVATFLALVLVLWRIQGARASATHFRGAVGLLAAALAYLLCRTGVLVAAQVPATVSMALSYPAVFSVVLLTYEFVEGYFDRAVSWFGWLNRGLSGSLVAVSSVMVVVAPDALVGLYTVFVRWVFVVVLVATFVAIRGLVRGTRQFGIVAASAIVLVTLTGLSDLMADLGVWNLPRLFSVGIFAVASAAAVVVTGEFLSIVGENHALSLTLASQNDELTIALRKAQESAEAKASFLAITSHELRTPLNSIINIPEGLLEDITETPVGRCLACQTATPGASGACPTCGRALTADSTVEMQLEPRSTMRLLKSVAASGKYLLMLVNDILDLSKLEARRTVLTREPTDVGELLDEVYATVESVAARAQVPLSFDKPPGRLIVELDPLRIKQVLLNLVSNAIKFSEGKGMVTVSVAARDAAIELHVRDQGIGIDPVHHAVIFEAFTQLDGGSTRRFGGTGLGLAISKGLVELHGGSIRLESAKGQGSTFIVRLPTGSKR